MDILLPLFITWLTFDIVNIFYDFSLEYSTLDNCLIHIKNQLNPYVYTKTVGLKTFI